VLAPHISDQSQVVERARDTLPVAQRALHDQALFVQWCRARVVALHLRYAAQAVERAGHAFAVARRLAQGDSLAEQRSRAPIVPLLACQDTRPSERLRARRPCPMRRVARLRIVPTVDIQGERALQPPPPLAQIVAHEPIPPERGDQPQPQRGPLHRRGRGHRRIDRHPDPRQRRPHVVVLGIQPGQPRHLVALHQLRLRRFR